MVMGLREGLVLIINARPVQVEHAEVYKVVIFLWPRANDVARLTVLLDKVKILWAWRIVSVNIWSKPFLALIFPSLKSQFRATEQCFAVW